MSYGLIEEMRTEFARQLRPFKSRRSRAEILRSANDHASTGEYVYVHYEPTRSEDGGIHLYSESGQPGYTVFIDGRLAEPLRSRDRLLVNGITLEVEFGAFPANVGPVDQVATVMRGESRI